MYVLSCCLHLVLTLIPANSVQQDPYIWEPLVVNEPVSGVSLSAIEETDSSNDQIFEEFQSKELELSSIIQSMGNLCARGSTTPANGAVCHWEPQCENGRLAMCCSRKTAYGRPTDCTRCVSALIILTLETNSLIIYR